MVEERSSLEAGDGTEFRPGDHVRIVCGALYGLNGVVTRPTSNHRYLLTVDGLAEGVHVVIGGFALEHIRPS